MKLSVQQAKAVFSIALYFASLAACVRVVLELGVVIFLVARKSN